MHPAGSFAVWLSNGRIYELLAADLPFEFSTPVRGYSPGETPSYFIIELEDGTAYEVPWDSVLHLCEPAYKYHVSQPIDSSPTAKRIGHRVKSGRLALGMTQAQLAELTGMTEGNISRLESGKHLPSLGTLEKVASALGLSLASLIVETV
jgi:DNA-binding XRE family transcriptional regulator